jgi:hypothetical protein
MTTILSACGLDAVGMCASKEDEGGGGTVALSVDGEASAS